MFNYHSRQVIALQQKYRDSVSADRVADDYDWCRERGITLPLNASHNDRLPIEYMVDIIERVENSPGNRFGRFVSACLDSIFPHK